MGDKELSEKDKLILQGRIYPAIQSCVNNRYKIILGIFIYYGFILNNEKTYQAFKNNPTFNLITSLIFSALVAHNFVNYWLNSVERMKYEGVKECFFDLNLMEIIFGIIASVLILVSYFLFRSLT